MSPSSLIFVAVVVIWASYLVVHVTRRREHLATARSVDRFSAQMRVLQRRAVRLDPPAPSTVRVSSASLARQRPLVAQATPEQIFSGAASVEPVVQSSVLAGAQTAAPEAPVDSHTPDFFTDEPTRRRALRLPRVSAGSRAARQVRGLAILASLAALFVVTVLAGLGIVSAWVVLAPVALLVGVGCWLRAAARSMAAQRRREAVAMRRQREREATQAREQAREARPSAPTMPVAQEFVARPQVQETERPDVAASVPQRELVGAVAASAARRLDPFEVAAMAHEALSTTRPIDPLLQDRDWSPTPVPPPTYTLKARAERPAPPPLDVPVPIEIDDDDIAWDERRQQPRVVSA